MDEVVAVAVDVRGAARSPLLRVVEGGLGWPVVDEGDPVLPARCVLVDVARAHTRSSTTPRVLLVSADDPPAAAATAALTADAVLDGIPTAERLRAAVRGLAQAGPDGPTPWATVAGARGGVGATTVSLAIAGLRAWRHGPTLLAARGVSHTDGAPTIAPADLASPAAWAAAAPARAVEDLRVVSLSAGPALQVGDVPTVLEIGVRDGPTDVLVVAPDRAGLHAVRAVPAGAVVIVGSGALTGDVRAAAHGRVVSCPWSARVAAAAVAGRLPADLPGRWLAPLAPVVDALERRAGGAA